VRVLIVDDSRAVRQRLLELLCDSRGVERIWQAADVPTALALVRSQPIDVAIVDISLGAQSGLELLGRLRSEHAQMLVVVLTNSSTDAHRHECLRRGAHHFFDKSHEFERAIELVASVAASVPAGA